MSIRQFRPKRNARRGISSGQKIWLNLFFFALIGLQISYPLVHNEVLRWVTIATVIVGALFAFTDAIINFGSRFSYLLCSITLVFAFLIEAAGQATSWPFGEYEYSATLGPQVLKVPLIVPLAWLMMSYPVLLVARKTMHNWVFIYGGFGLMAWDLFLDPQMVAANRWTWNFKGAGIPLESNIPLSNAVGWLFSGMILMAILNKVLPKERRKKAERTKHVDIFLIWTLFAGVVGNIFFFQQPKVAIIGGFAFAIFLWPFLYKTILGIPELN
jgi:putative membrane protein